MSLPVVICFHVYAKSADVIGWPSLHTASGLMWYVTVIGGPTLSVGMPVRMSPGT